MMKTLAIIPARGGSKRVPRKNIRPINGKPLLLHTIENSLKAKCLDMVVLSTDDEEIAELARKSGMYVPYIRPAELATDEAKGIDVLRHMVDYLEKNDIFHADCIVTLQVTSPLRKARHIEDAYDLFNSDPDADSLVSVVDMDSFSHTYLPYCVMKYDHRQKYLEYFLETEIRTQVKEPKQKVFARNSAIYFTRREKLDEYVYGGNTLAYVMEPEYSIDIDTEYDFLLAELLLKYHSEKETNDSK